MNEPKVSVAIRAFRRDWLPGAIASVLAQTWRDLELVIYDDAGDLEDVVATFRDPRIRYARASAKLGASGRFTAAVSLCRGDYIGVLDDDDRYDPRFVERLAAVLERDERAGAAVCRVIRDHRGRRSLEPAPGPAGPLPDVARHILLSRYAITPSAMLLRRTTLDAAEAFQPMPDGVAPDLFVNVRLSLTGWRHVLIDEALSIRGSHDGRLSASSKGVDYGVAALEQLKLTDPNLDRLRRQALAGWLISRAASRLSAGFRREALTDLEAAQASEASVHPFRRRMTAVAANTPLLGRLATLMAKSIARQWHYVRDILIPQIEAARKKAEDAKP